MQASKIRDPEKAATIQLNHRNSKALKTIYLFPMLSRTLAHKDQRSSRKARRILLDFREIQTKSFEERERERERTNEKLRTGN